VNKPVKRSQTSFEQQTVTKASPSRKSFSAAIGSELHLGAASSKRTRWYASPKLSKNPEWTIFPISGTLLALSAHRKLSDPSPGKEVVSRSIIY
jgi:hypothetical protein